MAVQMFIDFKPEPMTKSLSLTILLIVISAFLNVDELLIKLIFWSLLGFVLFCQVMFMGIIESKRPALLGE